MFSAHTDKLQTCLSSKWQDVKKYTFSKTIINIMRLVTSMILPFIQLKQEGMTVLLVLSNTEGREEASRVNKLFKLWIET